MFDIVLCRILSFEALKAQNARISSVWFLGCHTDVWTTTWDNLNYSSTQPCGSSAALSHDSSAWPRGTREEEQAAVAHAARWWWWCSVGSLWCDDHGRFKASRAPDRERTAPLAAGTVSRDSHRAGRRGRLPLEPQEDEGEERDRRAENARRQRQSRAGPRRLGTSQPRAGGHGNVTVNRALSPPACSPVNAPCRPPRRSHVLPQCAAFTSVAKGAAAAEVQSRTLHVADSQWQPARRQSERSIAAGLARVNANC